MGRERKHNKHLPKGVTLEHGAYYFRGTNRKQRFTFHDLRALSATSSENVLEASERLGHSSPPTTKHVYIRKPTKVKPLR